MGINITGLGAANGIGFKSKVSGGRYLPPKLKDALIGVWSAYGKSNNSTDRNIIKNKIKDRGGDFVISNAAFKLNSGFGKYEEDFTTWLRSNKIINFDDKSFKFNTNESWVLLYHKSNINKNTPSFKVNIKIEEKVGNLYYNYVDSNGIWKNIIIKSEEFETPISYNTLYTGETPVNIGFTSSGSLKGSVIQIPSFQGAFVTDGIDDLITSTKTVQEMLGGSNEITVVSMIYHINSRLSSGSGYTNYIDNNLPTGQQYFRNKVISQGFGKWGIYGYSSKNNAIPVPITNILGDKADYSSGQSGTYDGLLSSNAKFSPIGRSQITGSDTSSCAWYWTILANKVLTTDEINQVIEYYNLDRPGEIIKPSMLYDIRKQGITNINHAEFNDELIDYINGYNIKMYNMLWDKQSGIGNYPISFKDYTYLPARATVEINKDNFVITANTSASNFLEINTKTKSLPTYKVKIEGTSTITNGKLGYRFNTVDGTLFYKEILKDGEYEIPESPSTETATYSGWCITGGFNDSMNVKITLLAIDDITDAVVLDGINNFGKVTNVPIWKDYTICALRKWLYTATVDTGIGTGALISKSKVGSDGAFIAEQIFQLNPNITGSYNFGAGNSPLLNDKINEKSFAIQTKYTYGINRQTLSVGSGLDTNTLWLGTVRDNDPRFSYLALWNLMLFPYTMSNFILERQLKKYKLGSLYPDNSFPFRPVVTANSSTKSIQYFEVVTGKSLAVGDYVAKEQQIQLNIMLNDIDEVIKVTIDGKEVPLYSYNDGYYRYRFNIHNSYPKIDITIQEYVKYDDIVQPYPVIFVLQDKESGKELTYGNYVKVGDIIKVKSIIYYNQDLWSIHGYQIGDDSKIYSYNELINKDIVVTKPLSFGCIKKWLLSTAEPLFVYDPAIFTNNAIKTLGYLPDISGQNRHFKLYNFSYEGMSGKDGYPVVFGTNKTWIILRPNSDNTNYEVTPNIIKIYKSDNNSALLYSPVYNDGVIRKISVPSFKLKVTGLKEGQTLGYKYVSESDRNLVSAMAIIRDGIYDIPQSYPIEPDESTPNGSWIGFITNTKGDYDTTLEILSEYKGSLYFDGINDYGTVQNLTYGGKCLVSKLNYNFKSSVVYDQRSTLNNNPETNTFALVINITDDNAYSTRLTGDIYINNILNNYINNTDLNNNTHVVTAICSIVDSSNSEVPIFGRSKTGSNHTQFAMYRTILLPEVPNAADLAILNKWCGLPTGYLPKPEYYWDVTGKSNSDTATRNTIKNLGTAKPVASTSDEDAYSLENKNVAYEGMSGYNGYPVVFGANKTWETYATYNFTSTINDNKLHITKVLNSNGLIFSYVKRNDELLNIKEIPSFKIKVTGLEGESKLLYFYLSEENAANITILTLENGVHKIPKSLIPTNALPNSTWIGFKITSIQEGVSSFDCDITLEILPDYYGLCLDGITNYIECANIPAFTDYTYIIKFKDFDDNLYNSCVQYKGPYKRGGSAFIQDYISTDYSKYQLNFGRNNKISNTISVGFCTKTNYNGSTINSGTNSDGLGIVIGKWASYRKMIFYKEMLWSKSINNTYHINMLRNLINNGGIIDLNDSIFDQISNE